MTRIQRLRALSVAHDPIEAAYGHPDVRALELGGNLIVGLTGIPLEQRVSLLIVGAAGWEELGVLVNCDPR